MSSLRIIQMWGRLLEKLTLRQRMVLLNGILVFAVGLLLVLFVNLIAPFFISRDVGTPNTNTLVNTVDAQGNQITVLRETPAPEGYTIFHDAGFIRGDPLTVVRTLSLVGLILVVGIDFFAVRWVAQKSLQPIYNISEAAKRISAQSLNQHLNYQGSQDEVKDLADAFDSMLGRLEANFEQQSQFVSNLAHELRTPLTIMRMNVEILHSDPQASFEDYQELTITLEKSLTRLERLAQDLLLLTKGEKGIAYQTIFLGVLIEEILEELTPIAHENEINLKMSGEIDCEIRVDSILLQRALSNLVENGILYNHPGGFVEILCYKEVNQVVIEVCDNGIGIGENDQTHIFERFYRAKGVYTNNQNGKGLGLAITAHIIRLHQGCIEVESQLGVGTTFRVFLPL